MRTMGIALICVLGMSTGVGADERPAAKPASIAFFEAQIGPLLVDKCVACHRADQAKGGLDLSTRVGLLRGGDGGPGATPGKPDESPVYTRTLAHDGRPPEMPEQGEPLTDAQTAALKAWIADGAAWPEGRVLREKPKADASFWSLQPVRAIEPPAPLDAPGAWSRHPIDRFVWSKLREHGLRPNPPADPRTFLRRATFDLWGLPPAWEDVLAFERDCRESSAGPDDRLPDAAVERLVDRLLQSPRYGERWGRHWLDIAHYADTHGFERDQLRPHAWRYRDYVIEAFNRDLPYDQFVRQQIAGDVLAPDDPASVIATGFLAAGPWDFVGQVETRSDVLKRAARAGDLDDMLTQVMTSTMGLTINCARCHDHKLDPITQEEYYRLTAVFAGVKRGEREVSPSQSGRLAERKRELTERLGRVRGELARLTGDGWSLADLAGGGDGRGAARPDVGIDPRSGKLVAEKLGYHRDLPVNRLLKPELSAAGAGPDVQADGRPFVKYVFIPDGRGEVFVDEGRAVRGIPPTSGEAWDAIRNGPLNAQVATKLDGVDFAAPGRSILGLHANGGVTFDLTRLQTSGAPRNSGYQFTAVLGFGSGPGGAGTAADFSLFVDQELKYQKLKLKKDQTERLEIAVPADARTLTLIATDGGDGIGHDLLFLGDARLRPADDAVERTADERRRIDELRGEAAQLERELANRSEPDKVFAVVSETPPPIHLLRRGNPEEPQQQVTCGTPSCIKLTPPDFRDATTEGERRRRLADWIVHPDNPLTGRVLVNRLWHHHFGRGLVGTPSDFGYGGERPTHPELLDWLAGAALQSGWSLKSLHKTIMTSAVYRQSSATVAERAEVDGDARLLWRQHRRRLDAESLRDAVLLASGNLNLTMGGPGYRDFKYTEAYAPIYEYVTPDSPELWRRSVYRFVVRTTPHQFMSTLDCPDPANLTPARVVTTTALQALTLSNNEFMLQQAGHLARRLEAASTDRTLQIERAFQIALQRNPEPEELDAARRLVDRHGPFALCRSLLNANEFVYVD